MVRKTIFTQKQQKISAKSVSVSELNPCGRICGRKNLSYLRNLRENFLFLQKF